MYPTVADVLARPEVHAGAPVVRAGREALDTQVRWMHVSEIAEPAGTLPDGVLVLSVGLAADDPTTDPVRYVAALRAAGAVGLVIEIGQHLTALPDGLVQAARTAGFPLIELRRTVRFADLVAGVLGQVLTARHERAAFAEHVGTVFRTLTLHGEPPERIVGEAATLLATPVACEDLAHRVLHHAGAPDLRDWRARSRLAGAAGPEGWWTAPVGRPGARWGRLVVPQRPAPGSADRVATVLGHAADALSLLDPDPAALLRAAHDRLIGALACATPVDVERLAVEARASGMPAAGDVEIVLIGAGGGESDHGVDTGRAAGGRGIGTAGHGADDGRGGRSRAAGRADDTTAYPAPADGAAVRAAIAELAPDALVTSAPGHGSEPGAARRAASTARSGTSTVASAPAAELVVLVPLPGRTGGTAPSGGGSPAERLAERIAAEGAPVVALAGPGPFTALPELLREARLVVDARVGDPDPGPHRRSGLGVRGLVRALRDDPRLVGFAEDTLGPVLALPPDERAQALHGLHALVDSGGVVADLARRIGTGRPAAYARIRKLSALLGADLTEPEVRTAVHVALLAVR